MGEDLRRAEIEERVYEALIREGMVESPGERSLYIDDSIKGLRFTDCVGEEFGVEISGGDLEEMIDGGVVQVETIVDYLVGLNVE